ncbi:MAG: ECF transporter S component [Ruminococcaceae bacterium]|nr:ECF transporter S component [Oscillospiraceae bacterium]
MKTVKKVNLRALVVMAIMSALGYVLMLLEFPLPMLIPPFIKFDFSELPAIITSFALGPLYGVGVCFFKNALHLLNTTTFCVGELSNFLLGAIFVGVAGLVYKRKKTFKSAVVGTLIGAVIMAVISVFTNLFIVYPIYAELLVPMPVILSMYSAILPSVDSVFEALVIFNLPFNFSKGIIDAVVCFICYKKLSPILKGNNT